MVSELMATFTLPPLHLSNCVTVKLNDRNYIVWKSQFQSFLSIHLLLGFVDGSELAPASTIISLSSSGENTETPNPAYQTWYRSDQLVRSWILGSISDEILDLVVSCESAYDVWCALSAHFSRTSSSRLFDLQRSLQTISKSNKSIAEYLREFKLICDQLNSIGNPVSEKMKVYAVLHGLGRDYEAFVTVIESSMDDNSHLSYDEVTLRLLSFDERLRSYSVPHEMNPHMAYNTDRVHSYGSGYRGRGYHTRSFNTRGRGSFSTRGRGFHQQLASRPSGPTTDRPLCQICGRFGHLALRCWNRFDRGFQSDEVPSALTAVHHVDVSAANGREWFPDTGASAHVTNSAAHLRHSTPYHGLDSVMVGDGSYLPITHVGSATVPGSAGKLLLQEVLVCPSITKSLLSVSKLTSDYPCVFEFDADFVCVKDKVTQEVLSKGHKVNGLYVLEEPKFEAFYSSHSIRVSDAVWHQRLGHPNDQVMQFLISQNSIVVNKVSRQVCESCKLGKSVRLPFSESNFVASQPLERIHCDLWGPAPVKSVQGFRFYVIFVDQFSRFTWFYPLKNKSDFFVVFCQFQTMVENQLNQKIKTFQCDGGGEFTSTQFVSHLRNKGINQHISCPHTPEQNGMAERKHRHLIELGLSMLYHAKIPQQYWLEALATANFLSNLLPSSTSTRNISPFERLLGKAPGYSALRIFGCACYPTLRDYALNKLDPRSLKCVFLGYNDHYKGYRCLFPPTGRIYISRHVTFDESEFPFATTYVQFQPSSASGLYGIWLRGFHSTLSPRVSPSPTGFLEFNSGFESSLPPCSMFESNSDPTVPVATTSPSSVTTTTESHAELSSTDVLDTVSNTNPQVQSQTQNQEQPLHPMTTRSRVGIVKTNPRYVLLTQQVSYPEPATVTAALKHSGWKIAMTEEIDTLLETKTWTLVPRTSDMNVLGSKWVFKTKLQADGSLDRLKARLVAKGFHQEEGIDYLETYSPVVKSATVRIILHLATTMSWEIKQLDVKNAFLHGDLTETVFMTQPAGFVDSTKKDFVCHLHKSIYGLKQSPREWFNKFSDYLIEYGFTCSPADPSLFVYHKGSHIMCLLLYVDDMVLTGNDSDLLAALVTDLGTHFRMKDLGHLHYFLGIQVLSQPTGLCLSQKKYASDLLALAGMADCAPMPTPLPIQNSKTSTSDELFSDPTYFRSLAGKLQYLTMTRPDLQFAVNHVCQKMHAPLQSDFTNLKRILRYVKGTLDLGIIFEKDTDHTLRGYSDSDWGGCQISRRSTGGFCMFLGTNLISWSAKKQPTVSRSSTEAEYRALASAAAELTWIMSVLRDLGVPQPNTPELYCDNLSSVYLTANPTFHARTKHIEIDYHFVREKVALGSLIVKHVSAVNQLADVFTKSLPVNSFLNLRFKIGVDSVTPTLRGAVSNMDEAAPDKHTLQTSHEVVHEVDTLQTLQTSHEVAHEVVHEHVPSKQTALNSERDDSVHSKSVTNRANGVRLLESR